jgi:hypothetical protein
MPERWERDLERLRTVTAPRSTRARIDEGPHGEGMPPSPRRGQRIVVVVVAFAVFGAAAALVAGAFRSSGSMAAGPGPTATVVVHLDSSDGPAAALEYEGQTAHPQIGSHCWTQGGTGQCVDTVLSAFPDRSFVRVPPEASIVIDGDDSLRNTQVRLEPGADPSEIVRRSDLAAPIDRVYAATGTYVLVVSATWPQGSVEFFFPIEIVAPDGTPAVSPDLIATLDAPADGTAPTLVLRYGDHERSFFMQGGAWPGVDAFDLPIQWFDEPVAAGSVLRIDGDANRVMAEIGAEGASDPSDLDVASGSVVLPTDPGSYQLTFKGVWDAGVAAFPVWIHVEDVAAAPSTTVEPDPSGSTATGSPQPSTQPSAPPANPTTVVVPDVVGLTVNEALQVLHDAGLEAVGTWSSGADTTGVGEDVVVSQDPPAGTEVDPSTPVKLDAAAP